MMIGVALIVTGIIATIIQLSNFDVYTFNLGKSIVLVFGFSFVGISCIISAIALRPTETTTANKTTSRKKSLEDIASEVKSKLNEEQESKKPQPCPYCKTLIAASETKCPNCGASSKRK